jgi:hypothetical protein
LLKQNINFRWGEAQEAAFLKVVISFTSGKTLILRHYDPRRRALLVMDASDFAITGVLSQKFEDCKIHPIGFASRKLNPAELNYDVYNKEMLAVIYCVKFWQHFLEGAELKTRVLSDHQNLTYFKTAKVLNRRLLGVPPSSDSGSVKED